MTGSGAADWHAMIAAIAAVLTILAALPYAHAVLHRRARPDFVTWFLWSFTSGIGTAAQYASGASWSIELVAANAVTTGAIALLALRFGTKRYTTVDTLCMVIAICAIIGWVLTGDALVALVLAILADSIAAIPTILKARAHPRSEHAGAFFVLAFASALATLSTERFDVANVAYPLYFLFVYLLIGLLALRRTARR